MRAFHSFGPVSWTDVPFASTATVTGAVMKNRLVLVVVVVRARNVDHLAAAVAAAMRAHSVRAPRLVALRAGVHRRRGDLVLRAALAGARMRLLLLRNGHGWPEG